MKILQSIGVRGENDMMIYVLLFAMVALMMYEKRLIA